MISVLITTSGTGSRLGERTKYTNKSLVKVGDMYAICHILNCYPPTTEFIITLGYFGSHVRQFLSLAYPHLNISFVDIDIYEGKGSSLGYSMLKAKELLQKPFYFHCCDTILPHGFVLSDTNCVYVSKGSDTNTYASIQRNNTDVVEINPKGNYNSDLLYIGLSYIKDFKEFWLTLESLYNENKINSGLSDIHVIQKMIEKSIKFTFKEIKEWCDTGNEDMYNKTIKNFPSKYSVLEKYDESLCFFDTFVIKFFADSKVCNLRAERGKLLYPMSPNILGVTENFFSMEKINGIPLSECKIYNDIARLLEWTWDNLWCHTKKDCIFNEQCDRFYKNKTYGRLKKIQLLQGEKKTVNSLYTGTWQELLEKIDFSKLQTDTFSYFHGDFILDNIMKCPDNSFKLLDWRQDFDGNTIYGDMYYDLAKLRHNIYFNHMNILQGLYSVSHLENEVQVELKCNYTLIQQDKAIELFCQNKQLDYSKVKILTGIIWLNMAPLYEGKLSEFLFYFGKYNIALLLNSSITIL
jgi:choline kinase